MIMIIIAIYSMLIDIRHLGKTLHVIDFIPQKFPSGS